MRLDIDVLRDVLLYLESELKVEHIDGSIKSNSVDPFEIKSGDRFRKHSEETVLYAIRMLSDAGLINRCVSVGGDGFWGFSCIHDITFAGHEFLECVRDSGTWGKTKEIASKAGCHAVSFIGKRSAKPYLAQARSAERILAHGAGMGYSLMSAG